MSLSEYLKTFQWCKSDWSIPATSEQAKKLLQNCRAVPKEELTEELEDIIERSKSFPIPFPIDSARLQELKTRRPADRLKRNVASTYPLIHERVLLLMARFLIYKREYGSNIEKELYKEMSVPELVNRIVKKRAIMFVGSCDEYLLLSGKRGFDGWELVGTAEEHPPLVLENCLSYDEMKLSAFVFISGYTECINDGRRRNKGVSMEGIEDNAVIIGVIGTRFARRERMDYEDILITSEQNTVDNGFGEESTWSLLDVFKNTERRKGKQMWRNMWAEFFEVPCYTFKELTSQVKINFDAQPSAAQYVERYVKVPAAFPVVFDNEVYHKRLSLIADCSLLEADERAKLEGKECFLNIIGAGLGVWKVAVHQNNVYILSFLQRIRYLLDKGLINHVTDVNFAYIYMKEEAIPEIFGPSDETGAEKVMGKIFLDSSAHPRGGIKVTLNNREPSSKLTGEHEGKLLVMTYPWDGNAHPGNEYWSGSLQTSGDPAAACSTQVAELHNAHVNLRVSGTNLRVAGKHGLKPLQDYCALID